MQSFNYVQKSYKTELALNYKQTSKKERWTTYSNKEAGRKMQTEELFYVSHTYGSCFYFYLKIFSPNYTLMDALMVEGEGDLECMWVS